MLEKEQDVSEQPKAELSAPEIPISSATSFFRIKIQAVENIGLSEFKLTEGEILHFCTRAIF
jgi:hypothetical protein